MMLIRMYIRNYIYKKSLATVTQRGNDIMYDIRYYKSRTRRTKPPTSFDSLYVPVPGFKGSTA